MENKETTEETIQLLKEIEPMIHRISLFRFVPLPGSYVYKNPDKFRLNIENGRYNSTKWDNYHIHHNNYHWWGSIKDFKIMNEAYQELSTFVQEHWPSLI